MNDHVSVLLHEDSVQILAIKTHQIAVDIPGVNSLGGNDTSAFGVVKRRESKQWSGLLADPVYEAVLPDLGLPCSLEDVQQYL